MNLRANQRGQFLPVFLVVLVVVLIVIAVLYLLNNHKGQGTVPAFKPAVHHVLAPVKKMKSMVKSKPLSSTTTPTEAPANNAFDIDGPLKNRQILYRVLPDYPESAQEQGIQGKVVFEFHTKDDGSVSSNIILRHSSTSAELDNAAEDALLRWKFSTGPALEGVSLITFNFYMNGGH